MTDAGNFGQLANIALLVITRSQVRKAVIDLHGLFRPMEGAYSPRTIKGYATDVRLFMAWCEVRRTPRPHDLYFEHDRSVRIRKR